MSNPKSPYGIDRDEEFIKNKNLYEKKCKYFTRKYVDMRIYQKTYTHD